MDNQKPALHRRRLPDSPVRLPSVLFLSIIVSTIFSSSGFAQDRLWAVILVSGDTLPACEVGGATEDALLLICADSSSRIPLDSVKILVHHHQSQFQRGGLWGGLAGVVIGGTAGAISYEEPKPGPGWLGGLADIGSGSRFGSALVYGIGGGVLGFVVGGVIGTVVGGDDTYDLLSKTKEQKYRTIRPLVHSSKH